MPVAGRDGAGRVDPGSCSSEDGLQRDPRGRPGIAILHQQGHRDRQPVLVRESRRRPSAPRARRPRQAVRPVANRPCRSSTRSRTRSYSRDVPVRVTPAAMTASRPTRTPSSSAQPAPTKASSSTMTGRAPGGSSTPPIVTPAARWTLAPICAHEPTSTCESTIVAVADPRADVDVAGRHHDDVGAEVCAAADGGPAGDDPPRAVAHVARWDGGAVAERERSGRPGRRRPVTEPVQDRGLDIGSDAPAAGAGRIGFGGADPAGLEIVEERLGEPPGATPVAWPFDRAVPRVPSSAVMRPPPGRPCRSGRRPIPRRRACAGGRRGPPAARPRATAGEHGPRRRRAAPSPRARP